MPRSKSANVPRPEQLVAPVLHCNFREHAHAVNVRGRRARFVWTNAPPYRAHYRAHSMSIWQSMIDPSHRHWETMIGPSHRNREDPSSRAGVRGVALSKAASHSALIASRVGRHGDFDALADVRPGTRSMSTRHTFRARRGLADAGGTALLPRCSARTRWTGSRQYRRGPVPRSWPSSPRAPPRDSTIKLESRGKFEEISQAYDRNGSRE
jgi:hypothetical protein